MKKMKHVALFLGAVVVYVNIGHIYNEDLCALQYYGREAGVAKILLPTPEVLGVGSSWPTIKFGTTPLEKTRGLTFQEWKVEMAYWGVLLWPIPLLFGLVTATVLWIVQIGVWTGELCQAFLIFLFRGELARLMIEFWSIPILLVTITACIVVARWAKKTNNQQ